MKLLFATLGSTGDVLPFLSMAIAHQRQGGKAVLATDARYRALLARHDIPLLPIGDAGFFDIDVQRRAIAHPERGTQYFLRLANRPGLHRTITDLAEAAADCDGLVAPPTLFAAPIAAAKAGCRLVTCCLSPVAMTGERSGGMRKEHGRWRKILNAARSEHGLTPSPLPSLDGVLSADLILGLYPHWLADRDEHSVRPLTAVGFPMLSDGGQCAPSLRRWMGMGPFGLVTLGSYTDHAGGYLVETATEAFRLTGLRLLFQLPYARSFIDSDQVRIESFVPHREVMRQASVVVHHGGAGTLAEACYAGRPMVIAPFAHDQPCHAQRMGALDLAEILPPDEWSAHALATALSGAMARGESRARALRALQGDIGPHVPERAISAIWKHNGS